MSSENKNINIQWFPGHMKKAINRINEQLKIVDFVIELLDSRAPLSTQNEYIEKVIERKPKLYVLTKIDLSDENETKKRVEHFISRGDKCLALNLTKKDDYKKIFEKIMEFCEEKSQKYRKKGIKKVTTRGLIIGIPNVGKSTLINYLANKKIAQAANTPGLTRNVRWVKLGDFELMDTPGILEPQYEDKEKAIKLALLGGVKKEVLPNEELANIAISYLKKYHPEEFKDRYKINLDQNELQILEEIAKNRGYLLKNGIFDIDKARIILLNELRNGVICKISLDRIC